MKNIQSCLFYICILYLSSTIDGKGIRNIYFDPFTSISPLKHDGVVIIESEAGSKSTICMNAEYDSKNAAVICRMLGYDVKTTTVDAAAIITSTQSHFSNGTHYENIRCSGNEQDLSQCVGFHFINQTNFRCQNHNQDLHVLCLGEFLVTRTTINPLISDCSAGGRRIATVTHGSKGLLKIKNGTEEFTVCGINRNFGTKEAILFCNSLLCQNSTYARIVEGYVYAGAPIGGFKNMKCPTNAKSLEDCTNVYAHDKEGCTPNDNIGVICSYDPFVADPNPEVECNETSLSLKWKKSVHSDIDPKYVSILDNGKICKDVKIDSSVKLTVNYTDCGMQKNGDNDTIIYTFQAKRVYPIFQNIILKDDQLYNVSCIIPRNATTSEVYYEIDSSTWLPTISDSFHIPNSMMISLDSKFRSKLSTIHNVKVGTEIFVKVQLMKPPSQLVPFLEQCVVESGTTIEPLIINKCSARSDVVISPLDKVTIMFSFKSFAIGSINDPTNIRCLTSMCGRDTNGCIPTCHSML